MIRFYFCHNTKQTNVRRRHSFQTITLRMEQLLLHTLPRPQVESIDIVQNHFDLEAVKPFECIKSRTIFIDLRKNRR